MAGIGRVVLLARSESPMPLSQAEEIVLRGEGYESEVEAEEAASRWVAGLRVALAGSLIGADFGRRGPASPSCVGVDRQREGRGDGRRRAQCRRRAARSS